MGSVAVKPAATRSPLAILFTVVFLDLLGFGIVIPLLPYYAKQYGGSATALGFLMATYSVMQFVFAPIWGQLSDRVGRRPILVSSIFGQAAAMMLLAFAPSLPWLFVARTIAGVCAANISTAMAYAADVTTSEDRTKGMGLLGAAFGLGFVFGPAIGGLLSSHGYRVPIVLAACLSFANGLFALASLPEPATHADASKSRFTLTRAGAVLTNTRIAGAVFIFLVVTLAFAQMETTFALFMLARHTLDARGAGLLLALLGIVMAMVQGGFAARLAKRIGEASLVTIGTLAMSLGLAGLAMSPTVALAAASLTVLAVGYGLNAPSLSSLASKGARPNARGLAMGAYQSAASLGRVFGPLAAGWIFDRFGGGRAILVAAALMLAASAGSWLWHGGTGPDAGAPEAL